MSKYLSTHEQDVLMGMARHVHRGCCNVFLELTCLFGRDRMDVIDTCFEDYLVQL